uniref:Uncharacterized protein n=1 Tax=Romanomermis culicivorax TaxID=13658 RepID=A0A915IGQ3_ROMCU
MPIIMRSTKRKTVGTASTTPPPPPVILTQDQEDGMPSTAIIMYFITSVCIFALLALMITFGVYNKRKKDTRRSNRDYRKVDDKC